MASAYISINTTASTTASQTKSAIDSLRSVRENMDHLKSVFDQMALGGDWAALAGYLGVTAAQAETIYNLWGSANGELQADVFVAQLIARCG